MADGGERSKDQTPALLKGRGDVPRLGIVIPSGDTVNANFAVCLAAMMYKTGIPVALYNTKGSNIANNRSNGALRCQEWGADYCLMIDSDIGFPSDASLRLVALARKHDLDVVGATYVSRSQPHQNHARPIPGRENVHGLAEVAALPTGMMMFNMRVLDKLTKPYFRFASIDEKESAPELYKDLVAPGFYGPVGEDFDFCCRVRAAGFRVWLDVELSCQIQHYGEVGYRLRTEPSEKTGRLYDVMELAA